MSGSIVPYKERHIELKGELERKLDIIAGVIPVGCTLTAPRMVNMVLAACVRDPTLLECWLPSILRSLEQSAECGLELASPFGAAYLVPFKNWKKKSRKEAQFIPGYKGLIQLALGSPNVDCVEARIVREGDAFDYEYGTNPRVHHVPSKEPTTGRAVQAAYCVSWLMSGRSSFTVMDRAQLDRIRAGAKATGENSPWNKHTDEMYRKCPTRNHMKTMDLSQRAQLALGYDNEAHVDALPQDGFSGGRGNALKAELRKAQAMPVASDVGDADFDDEAT